MKKAITCSDCGRVETYEKPEGTSGRPPQKCRDHRVEWPHVNAEKRWRPVGDAHYLPGDVDKPRHGALNEAFRCVLFVGHAGKCVMVRR